MKRGRLALVWRSIAGLLFLLLSGYVNGHSPHDVIDILRVCDSPRPDTLFVVVSHKLLMRSIDNGASWKELNNGLDNRYSYTDMAMSRSRACASVYLSTDGDGIYKSGDGGNSWRNISQRLPESRIKHIYLTDDGVLLAAGTTGGVYRTEDDGASWQQVINESAAVTAFGAWGTTIWAGDGEGHIFQSTDSGSDWSHINRLEESSISAISNVSERKTLIGTAGNGLFRTADGGDTFERVDRDIQDKRITAISSSRQGNREVIVVSTWDKAAYLSEDAGENWGLLMNGLTTDPQAAQPTHHAPQFRDIVTAADGTLYLAGFDGLFRSRNQGAEWRQVATLGEDRIIGLGVSSVGSPATIGLTAYGGGAYFMNLDTAVWDIRNYGLMNPRLTDIVLFPSVRNEWGVVTAAPGELLFSIPAGEPWKMETLKPGMLTEVKKKLVHYLRKLDAPVSVTSWLLTDQEKRKPFPTRIAVEPGLNPEERDVWIGTRRHGVLRKVLSADYYTTVLDRREMISSLELSPDFQKDHTVYVSARQEGILMSVDGGTTWEPVNTGLDFINAWNSERSKSARNLVELARSPYFDIHLAISPDFDDDSTLFAGTGEGLYRSLDGGAHWIRQKVTSDAQEQIIAISVSPEYKTEKTVMVSVKGRGLHISLDGGTTFKPYGQILREDNHEIRHIKFSRKRSKKIVIASSGESVFYTRDAGRTWKHLARPVRIEDKRERIEYAGSWKRVVSDRYSSQSAKQPSESGSTARLEFWGNGIRWIGNKGPGLSKATVVIDGDGEELVEQYSKTSIKSVKVYEKTDLAPGPHSIEVRGGAVIDAFDILGSR